MPAQKTVSGKKNNTLGNARIATESIATSSRKLPVEKSSGGLTNKWWPEIILFALAFFVYSNSLSNGFAIDDTAFITNNNYVQKGFGGIWELIKTPHMRGFMIAPNDTYRPLSLIAFALQVQFWGVVPGPGHFFNVLTFALCVIVLFRFINALFDNQRKPLAFLACALFALHPIHSEVVNNIKNLDELLCFLFGFMALNLFLNYSKTGKLSQVALGTLSLFIAFLSKETVIVFLGLVPLVFLFIKRGEKKRNIAVLSGTLVATIAFLGLRAFVLYMNNNTMSDIAMIDNSLAKAPDLATKLATAVYILGYYVKLIFIPYPLVCDYSFNSIPFTNFGNTLVLLTIAGYLGLTSLAVIRIIKDRKDPWGFSILFFIISISLYSNIAFLIGSTMNERFLFFASVGFCLALALGIEKFATLKTSVSFNLFSARAVGAFAPLMLIAFIITHNRNKDWADDYTLYSADLKNSPNSSRLNYCVGYVMVTKMYEAEKDSNLKKKLLKEGIEHLDRSLQIFPGYMGAQTELGYAYFEAHMYDSAQHHDEQALKINPDNTETINNLAGVYFVTSQYNKALELCRKAIKLRPNYAQAYYNMGLCFYNMRQLDSSIAYLGRCLNLDRGFNQSNELLAKTYKALQKEDSAQKYYSMAVSKNPTFRY